ncbi:glycoside hydrolase family 127 protein [Flagellimonas crocea]|uniref:glycoside hydrolase family 127 protein n=1 Tax=Flagellimonas crocea TaxID=3067311 RepID=UPI00296E7A69|nr:glycoside hydrolase family 127 protein [Muricauda sp. DH64]
MSKMMKILVFLTCLIFGLQFGQAQEKLYPNEFSLGDVELLDGPFKDARDLNIEVLLKYDPDRLLAPYRKEAGLKPKAPAYPNWEGLDGHVGGHYLSAMAMNYAATGNLECKQRMDYMVSQLKECQDANAKNNPEWGKGYAGGFPNSAKLWSSFKNGDFKVYFSSWAPWYNLHKMYAGLRDAYIYGDNEMARDIFLKFCDWGIELTAGLTDEQMQRMLDMEHGGINESYADAYQISGDEKYLLAAKRFSHRQVLDPLSKGIDNLNNKHANTQIPKFIGFDRIAELDDADKYSSASSYFWETVVNNRSLAFGGNSRKEHFPSVASSIDYVTEDDGPESCNSYNMLKLTEGLFRKFPNAKYADYYEKTLYNHILSTQHPEHGGYVYFTSARPRHYRVYSAPNEAMWCCVGTGMENHGKYNQFIYSRNQDALYINLFIASELDWKEKGIKLKQETDFPNGETTRLTFTEGDGNFQLLIRYPGWVEKQAFKIKINGEVYEHAAIPSSYIPIEREWKKGDVVEISLPMKNHIERLPNIPQYVAFFHGPILLGAKTGTEDLKGLIADDSRFGQYAGGKRLPLDQAPILIAEDVESVGKKLEPISGKPLQFKLNVKMINPAKLELEPFYKIHDSRYMMYWLTLSEDGYKSYLDSLSNIEKKKLELERRTVDHVATGEQQPESDHYMEEAKSNSGNSHDDFWREARDEGYFSYKMATGSQSNLNLLVRYWGFEWGQRKFDIYVEDEKLVTVDNTKKYNISQFKQETYPIPEPLLKGKEFVRVKFVAHPNSAVSAVYDVRLVSPD